MHAALAAAATLVSVAFALSTGERWLRTRKRHEAAWTISLAMFALGSLSLWWGASAGWDEWSFKSFYLFGAILNVPFLALGTVELLAGPTHGKRWMAIISMLGAFCTGIMVATPLIGVIDPEVLPQGKDVFGLGPRIAAAVGSGVAALVIIAGAMWSSWRLFRVWRSDAEARTRATGAPSPRRLAVANLFIATGTLILSAGGLLNSVVNEMDGFAISLVAGISVIFIGFLMTARTSTTQLHAVAEPEVWRAPSVDAA
ncbi:MAG: hypothetical protein WEA11_00345 [Acidimicrobiales bacterium]